MDLPDSMPGTFGILRGFLKSNRQTNPLDPQYTLPGEKELSERYQ